MVAFILAAAAVAATFWMLFRVNSFDPYSYEEMRSFMDHDFAIKRRLTKAVVLVSSLAMLGSSGAAWAFEIQTISVLVAVVVAYVLIGIIAVALHAPRLKFTELSSDPLLQALALVPTWPVWIFGS